jgi:hypothetical protein
VYGEGGRACAGSGGTLEQIAAEAAKLASSIRRACEVKGLTPGDLRSSDGLGFDAVARECASVATVAGIADCEAAQHACRAEEIFEVQEPRARELITKSTAAAGLPAAALPCLHDLGDGGSLGHPKGAGKRVLRCESTIAKAGRKFVAAKSKSLQKCRCGLRLRRGEGGRRGQACLDGKAAATCVKEIGKIRTAARALALSVDKKRLLTGLLRDGAVAAERRQPRAPTVECAGVGATRTPGLPAVSRRPARARRRAVRLEVPRRRAASARRMHARRLAVRSFGHRPALYARAAAGKTGCAGAPRLPDGRFFVLGTPDASLTVDPTLAGPVTAPGACTRWITTCVDLASRSSTTAPARRPARPIVRGGGSGLLPDRMLRRLLHASLASGRLPRSARSISATRAASGRAGVARRGVP